MEALLEPNGEIGDDDGQALVDAIEETYQTAEGAAETANDAMTAVQGLSGEEGTVAANTGAIAALTAEDDPTTEDVTKPVRSRRIQLAPRTTQATLQR